MVGGLGGRYGGWVREGGEGRGGGEGERRMEASREFLALIKAIGEAKSKQEEDRIMAREVAYLKRRMGAPDTSSKRMKEYLVRLLYVEMLGHDAGFGYIHAVNLAQRGELLLKKVGYLAVTLLLRPDHELMILLVNTMQRDLRSDNFLEVCAALSALCRLASAESVPLFVGQVGGLLGHVKEAVRKKAVMTLHRFAQVDPGLAGAEDGALRRKVMEALCDRDPSVMGAALCAVQDLCKDDPGPWRGLLPNLVSILKQVVGDKLPKDFYYRRMPAPWLQCRLLRVMALLARGDRARSEGLYMVIGQTLQRADNGEQIGNAVLFECIRCVTTIVPSEGLLEASAAAVARFLGSGSNNLRYLGVDALASIIAIDPRYARDHQLSVLDCLESSDDTLKRKTLELLYRMTHPGNVEVIVGRMVDYVKGPADAWSRREAAHRVAELAERFAPSAVWYLDTMNRLLELPGDFVKPGSAHNLMRLLAEGEEGGGGGGEQAARGGGGNDDLRSYACEHYLDVLETNAGRDRGGEAGQGGGAGARGPGGPGLSALPRTLVQVACWVLGEYAYLLPAGDQEVAVSALCWAARGVDAAEAGRSTGAWEDPRCYAVSALAKCLGQRVAHGAVASGEPMPPPEVADLVAHLRRSKNSDLVQRCEELLVLCGEPPAIAAALAPRDASCEDPDPSALAPLLDAFERRAAERGDRRRHVPKGERQGAPLPPTALGRFSAGDLSSAPGGVGASPSSGLAGLQYEAYAAPEVPRPKVQAAADPRAASAASSLPLPGVATLEQILGPQGAAIAAEHGARPQHAGKPQKWSAQGYAGRSPGAGASAPSPSPSGAGAGTGALPMPAPTSAVTQELQTEEEMIAAAIAASLVTAQAEGIMDGSGAPIPLQLAPSTGPAAGQTPPQPRAEQERERVAASLFGDSASASPARGAAGAARPKGRQVQARTPPKAPPDVNLVDLGDLAGGAAPAAAAASGGRQPQGDVDLLADLLDTSVAVSAPSSSSRGGPSTGPPDLFAVAGGPAPATPGDDLLSALGAQTSPLPPSSSALVLSPAEMSEESFGTLWGSHTAEELVRAVVTPGTTSEGVVRGLESSLGCRLVVVKGTEAIACGRFPGVSPNAFALLHCQLSAADGSCALRVRTSDAIRTAAVSRAARAAFDARGGAEAASAPAAPATAPAPAPRPPEDSLIDLL